MKRSGQVGLTLMTALGLASIARAMPTQPLAGVDPSLPQDAALNWADPVRDPCSPLYYDQQACDAQLRRRSGPYSGFWIPRMISTHPITQHWHCVRPITPAGLPQSPFRNPTTGRVARGGFDTTTAVAHGSHSGS